MYGNLCVAEFVRYKYGQNAEGDNYCRDLPGLCERALCECDLQLRLTICKAHVAQVDVFSTQFHWDWTTIGWTVDQGHPTLNVAAEVTGHTLCTTPSTMFAALERSKKDTFLASVKRKNGNCFMNKIQFPRISK